MRHLPREEILPREKSANSAGQEISIAHKATHRRARVCRPSRQDPPRTIIHTVARHVDFAAAAKESRKSKANLQIDLSLHKSSGCFERLRAAPAQIQYILAVLDQTQFTRGNSDSLASPQSIAASSATRSTLVREA